MEEERGGGWNDERKVGFFSLTLRIHFILIQTHSLTAGSLTARAGL